MTIFYAWTAPASIVGAVADHTWVTTYDNRSHHYADIAAVTGAGEDFWYCWGMYRPRGGTPVNPSGFLGSQAGNRGFARCLVAPNLDSIAHPPARGTVFKYGVDGVCHQLSNQVLFATGGSGSPLTVQRARGYTASIFVYGVDGRQRSAWSNQVATCGAPGGSGVGISGGGVAGPLDEFVIRAGEALGGDPARLAALMELRGRIEMQLAQLSASQIVPSAEFLNRQNEEFFAEAAAILGADDFERLFGFPPGEQPLLVDPAIQEAQRNWEDGGPF